jgi:hypothetical protein
VNTSLEVGVVVAKSLAHPTRVNTSLEVGVVVAKSHVHPTRVNIILDAQEEGATVVVTQEATVAVPLAAAVTQAGVALAAADDLMRAN